MLETIQEIEETETPWGSVEEDESVYKRSAERITLAEKTLQESEDVMEILESLAVINGWSEVEDIWEFIDLEQDQYADAVVKCLLEQGYHSDIVSEKIRWFVDYNEGCTMFEDYLKIEEGQEEEEEDEDAEEEDVGEVEEEVEEVEEDPVENDIGDCLETIQSETENVLSGIAAVWRAVESGDLEEVKKQKSFLQLDLEGDYEKTEEAMKEWRGYSPEAYAAFISALVEGCAVLSAVE